MTSQREEIDQPNRIQNSRNANPSPGPGQKQSEEIIATKWSQPNGPGFLAENFLYL
jgi:hypothetical protein